MRAAILLLLVLAACSQSAAPVETGVRGWDGEEVTEDNIGDWSATPSSLPFDEDDAVIEPAASATEIAVPTTATTVAEEPDDLVDETTTTEAAIVTESGSGDQMVWLWAPW